MRRGGALVRFTERSLPVERKEETKGKSELSVWKTESLRGRRPRVSKERMKRANEGFVKRMLVFSKRANVREAACTSNW